MTFKLGTSSRKNLEGVNPKLIQVIEYALTKSKVDFGIPKLGGMRTSLEQRKLFIEGKSQLDGYEKKSAHQSGDAFDIFAYVDGKASYEEKDLLQCATAILHAASVHGLALEWGGLWLNFVDMPHFQITESEQGIKA